MHTSCPLSPPCRSNVAQHCAQKLLDEGAIVLGMSDSGGYIYESGGLTREHLAQVGRTGLSLRLTQLLLGGSVGGEEGRTAARQGTISRAASVAGPTSMHPMCQEPPHMHVLRSTQICAIKESHSGQLEEYSSPTAVYVPGRRVWEVDTQIDAAFPCATQASGAVLRRHALHALGLQAVVGGHTSGQTVCPCATQASACCPVLAFCTY